MKVLLIRLSAIQALLQILDFFFNLERLHVMMQPKTLRTSVHGIAHPLTVSEFFVDSDILFEHFEILK